MFIAIVITMTTGPGVGGTGTSLKWQLFVVPRLASYSSSSVATCNTYTIFKLNLALNLTDES